MLTHCHYPFTQRDIEKTPNRSRIVEFTGSLHAWKTPNRAGQKASQNWAGNEERFNTIITRSFLVEVFLSSKFEFFQNHFEPRLALSPLALLKALKLKKGKLYTFGYKGLMTVDAKDKQTIELLANLVQSLDFQG